MRSEPDGKPGSVTMASPPCALTAWAISFSAAATSTWPTLASTARFHTWTIIGRPQISASGLHGSRVEAIRAGITIMVFWCSIIDLAWGAANCDEPSYTYCKDRAEALVSAPDAGAHRGRIVYGTKARILSGCRRGAGHRVNGF